MNWLTRRYQEELHRTRHVVSTSVGRAWDSLGHYDQGEVPDFVNLAVPIVGAGQAHAVALTDAYLATATKRAPIGLAVASLVGAAVRNGTSPDQVYARPFVNVWSALAAERGWEDAVASGRARAVSAAAMDVALSTRAAASAVGEQDDNIVGFSRVPDDGACDFCLAAAEQRYGTGDLMPLHNNCGCTVEPIEGSQQYRFSAPSDDSSITGDGVTVDVVDHGELGPLLVNAADHFTTEADIADSDPTFEDDNELVTL